jgi:integrase
MRSSTAETQCVPSNDTDAGDSAAKYSMVAKITKMRVDSTHPLDKDRFVWDTELKGFGLKVTKLGREKVAKDGRKMAAGGEKTYILQYRKGGRGSPTKRVTIGRHGALTPDQARKEAARLLGAIAQGDDPAAVRAAARVAPTITVLAERFLAEHVATKTKPKTAYAYRRLVNCVIVPAIGAKRVRDVTRADVSRLHHDRRATPYAANLTLAVLSKMFTLAEKWGERPDGSNPCRHVELYAERKRERMLSAAEFARLANALKAHRSPYVVAAIKLLIFTGARLSEILTLKWDWVDFGRGEARLPDSKTGAKTLHLPAPALAVLAELPRIEGNPHVIVGNVAGARLVNLHKSWVAIRNAAGLHDVRLHDLRHAFASVAASSGMGLPIIGKMLGHTQAATTHRYAHLASDPVKAAVNSVAEKIAAAMQGNAATTGEVVLLRKVPA